MLFQLNDSELESLGAKITTREIQQQPSLWIETLELFEKNNVVINNFMSKMKETHERIRVIFTGAGTSAYVGDTVITYLKGKVDEKHLLLSSIATTDIVSNPYDFYKEDIPTLLVSFARSGNSPESLAAVSLGKQMVKNFYQLTITCASDGKLALNAKNDPNNLLLLMPVNSNDKGFAMTGSYTCMLLTTLLVFDTESFDDKRKYVSLVSSLGNDLINDEAFIQKLIDRDFNRVVYMGSGSLSGMAREAQLKILELTAGKIATLFDSSMGLRHGPKSFIDENTLIFGFVSNNPYTRRYDVDILNELNQDQIAAEVCGIMVKAEDDYQGEKYIFKSEASGLPDAYLALPYVMFAQIVSVMSALKVKNKPDTPSPTGTVNRVVQGVKIYNY